MDPKKYWLYAAYGSNVNCDQMRERCRDAKFVQAGILENHRFVFATSRKDGTKCVANIVCAQGEETPIAIYKVSDSDLECLDEWEGVHNDKYRRVTKRAKDLDEDLVFYVLNKKYKSNPAIKIKDGYANIIIRGLEARNMGTCHVHRAMKELSQNDDA